jgi:outer membrane receptor protein involved in Fe transport
MCRRAALPNNENTYTLDGVNITDPVTGTFSVNFNFDAIEQIEVLLGGYLPEHGQSLGAVINIVTESGTNSLQFDSSVYYGNGNLRPRMDHRIAADGATIAPTGFGSSLETIDVNAKVSGPIVRDKAWFVVSYAQERSCLPTRGLRCLGTSRPTRSWRSSPYSQAPATSRRRDRLGRAACAHRRRVGGLGEPLTRRAHPPVHGRRCSAARVWSTAAGGYATGAGSRARAAPGAAKASASAIRPARCSPA